MKICVLGDNILSQEFDRLEYVVFAGEFNEIKTSDLENYDVVINTYDCNGDDIPRMKRCNVDLPLILSEYCAKYNKRYVHISTTKLYESGLDIYNESSKLSAKCPYTASKLLGESVCNKRDIIVRTNNLYNGECDSSNYLFRSIINSTPAKNLESISWTIDVIRAIISLLRSKQRGVYNVTSINPTSQAEICKLIGITNIAPTKVIDEDFMIVDISKLQRYIVPMDAIDNIPKCFKMIKEKLGE